MKKETLYTALYTLFGLNIAILYWLYRNIPACDRVPCETEITDLPAFMLTGLLAVEVQRVTVILESTAVPVDRQS